ncbi:retrovirus-related Pol polyprotein from transposon 412 [Sminthopsis crassicaudata]|uniref:retrovirus-related Pol polyprotein from transposon 412 n=1 Tax=Sminthopsis crassicaudata TaxID=9301 RepID=UPI003D699D37
MFPPAYILWLDNWWTVVLFVEGLTGLPNANFQKGDDLLESDYSKASRWTLLSCHQWVEFLLVIVDHLTSWVEAFPSGRATASTVSKVLLEQIIPRYGMVERIDSDQGTHFSAQVLQNLIRALEITWDLHTPWHPPSSGKVERMNQEIKWQLTKLSLETQLPWTKCLPLALVRIRTKPRRDIGLSPYELLYGHPFQAYPKGDWDPILETKDLFVKRYVKSLLEHLQGLQQKGLIAQTPPLGFPVHRIQVGDWVLIRSWKDEKLTPCWDGPYQVILTSDTAIRTQERGWTHHTRTKGPVAPPLSEWTVEDRGDLQLHKRRGPPLNGNTDSESSAL